jgi:DNA gyrase subunit A
MAEEEKKDTRGVVAQGTIVEAGISAEMKQSFLDYAMSVITSRALPDVRDGLKPVQRRILYAMHELGLVPGAKTRKSAAIVGDVLGKYHPHGDMSVYEAMVNLIQPFSMRYPMGIGQGNFGNLDGDPAAAPRYTEAKLSKLAVDTLKDIEKETVEWRPNYENRMMEPTVLPAAAPNLLLNGTLGIAVGMASNIPPHNLREVVDACIHLLENEEATTDDLLQFVKGPDFPTGGLAFGEKDIHAAYQSGRGGVVCRGEAEIVEEKSGSFQIVITSIPYRVNKSVLIETIAEHVREKRLEGIKGLRDESTDDVRIVVDVKPSAHPQAILNYLYKHTQLEETFHYNTVALVDGVPQTLSLKNLLSSFLDHRREVVRRRTQFDLTRAEDREHILLGLKKALDHIDEIIQLIKKSKDTAEAHANLMKKFGFSDRQATAILDLKLARLANLERKKIEDELAEVQALIEELRALLASKKKMENLIGKELRDVAEKHGDDRRTRIVKHGAKNMNAEDLIPDEEQALVLSKGGYIKRTNPAEYRQQKRGGVGVIDLDTKDEDFVQIIMMASTHSDLLFFSDAGKVYQIKMHELPEGKRATRGKSIVNFLPLAQDEAITSILPMPKDKKAQSGLSVVMVTLGGTAKKVAAESFRDVRRSGIIAISLDGEDRLQSASFASVGDSVIVVTAKGQSIRFAEDDVRQMGRTAAGVRGITLGKGDSVIAAGAVPKDCVDGKCAAALLVLSERGYGKRTDISEYKVQGRGGSGIKTADVTSKTGFLVAAALVTEGVEGELVAISRKAQIVRCSVAEVPTLGRQTQGVRIMKLREGDSVASGICF